MVHINFKIVGPGKIYLNTATDNVFTVANEAANLGKQVAFAKATIIAKFKSTS